MWINKAELSFDRLTISADEAYDNLNIILAAMSDVMMKELSPILLRRRDVDGMSWNHHDNSIEHVLPQGRPKFLVYVRISLEVMHANMLDVGGFGCG